MSRTTRELAHQFTETVHRDECIRLCERAFGEKNETECASILHSCVFMMGTEPRLREKSRTSQFKAFCCGLIAVGQTSIHRWGEAVTLHN